MKKGRSNYSFELGNNIGTGEQLIKSYLSANNFVQESKNGESYFKAGDAMIGYRYFNYSINGSLLNISAWLKGAFGEIGIDQNGLTSMNMFIMNYRNELNNLFNEIQKINNGGSMNNTNNLNQNINNNSVNQQSSNNDNQFSQTFQNETIKKQEKMCEIGFWLSIFGLICSLFGVAYGVIIYIMDFYFASQGLKTRKRGKAIATIIMSIISIFIIIIGLMASA